MFILSSICALALNSAAMPAQQDTVDRYVINNEKIEKFDGSQLEGKTVKSYSIILATGDAGTTVYRVHDISTEQNTITIKGVSAETSGTKPLYIVDGKEMEKGSTLSIAPDKIASIKVFKPGSREAAVYGEKGDNGVVVVSIVTDKDNASDSGALEPLYIIDGEIVDKKAVDKLDVNKIESINVVKDQYAAKRYTDETKAGVVYIKTKK